MRISRKQRATAPDPILLTAVPLWRWLQQRMHLEEVSERQVDVLKTQTNADTVRGKKSIQMDNLIARVKSLEQKLSRSYFYILLCMILYCLMLSDVDCLLADFCISFYTTLYYVLIDDA